ncbi:MAG: hypothetical protein N2572_07325 [Syntrophales bacterium]|nr:hypothetical protein [Syntrophales bacterium]
MATVMPEGENIRNAIKWISAQQEENKGEPLMKLIEKAALQFDLSPLDTEFLMNFFRKKE